MNSAAVKKSFSQKVELRSDEPKTFLPAGELTMYISGCVANDRLSQKNLYTVFYSYAKAIADCYAKRNDDSVEIVNDAFLKIFKDIHRYQPAYSDVVSSFKGWLRRILIHTAIDHFRRNNKHDLARDLPENVIQMSAGRTTAIDNIFCKEIMNAINELSPGYRMVLNLYTIEGLTHVEISKLLGISVGASKSNLSKARKRLEEILSQRNQFIRSLV